MELEFENEMDTLLKRALHYTQCYDMHFPTSGASDVIKELIEEIHRLSTEGVQASLSQN
jgi:hypothetical protein